MSLRIHCPNPLDIMKLPNDVSKNQNNLRRNLLGWKICARYSSLAFMLLFKLKHIETCQNTFVAHKARGECQAISANLQESPKKVDIFRTRGEVIGRCPVKYRYLSHIFETWEYFELINLYITYPPTLKLFQISIIY